MWPAGLRDPSLFHLKPALGSGKVNFMIYSTITTNRKGDSVSPCITPAVMSNGWITLSVRCIHGGTGLRVHRYNGFQELGFNCYYPSTVFHSR